MLAEYGLFLAQTVTVVLAIVIVVITIAGAAARAKNANQDNLTASNLNKRYQELKDVLSKEVFDKKILKKQKKAQKKQTKAAQKEKIRKVFVVNFNGDMKASTVANLRQEISAILTVATPDDEVVVNLESPGGVVYGYGLAASQLSRVRDKNIPLTVCVDKVAASGGYMMACVADKILAAPFAIIGSIGVVMQLPNFNRLLKDKHIDFEQVTAGEYKRTLTVFGENTPADRQKAQEDIDDIHQSFKQHIRYNRPQVDIEQVATGEHWLAVKAKEFNLVDEIMTSDDYLMNATNDADIIEVTYHTKRKMADKLVGAARSVYAEFFGCGNGM